ncbi:hypothetical protein PAAG_12610 [Paracoccidioides lutzii Pb01]|uniref:Rhodopsin domain-containing protein n=1 Tax=Paracoccidioides lutzii (strain ATCC MYA-826 / Pb01) TaxID=502779 RepID=A0A0A2UZR4_PARBA|nr:hypothetical protein PAAG_12610 [Paracoccidioides lutzii Pb01]KGQ00718.1 hypothetical protein PAAG_12610 [Paracoccidioides lutzii Pb01]
MRIAFYGAFIFIALYALRALPASFLTRIPVKGFRGNTFRARCTKLDALWLITAMVQIVTSVVLLTMPMPILSTLSYKADSSSRASLHCWGIMDVRSKRDESKKIAPRQQRRFGQTESQEGIGQDHVMEPVHHA